MQESTLSILMKRMYFRNVFLALAMVLSISVEVCAAVKIRGKVTDEKNDPMEFVTVRIAGTALGATTGLDGGYNISAADADTIRVIFSCIGYMESKRTLIGRKAMSPLMSRWSRLPISFRKFRSRTFKSRQAQCRP